MTYADHIYYMLETADTCLSMRCWLRVIEFSGHMSGHEVHIENPVSGDKTPLGGIKERASGKPRLEIAEGEWIPWNIHEAFWLSSQYNRRINDS